MCNLLYRRVYEFVGVGRTSEGSKTRFKRFREMDAAAAASPENSGVRASINLQKAGLVMGKRCMGREWQLV